MKVGELIRLLETQGWSIIRERNGHKILKHPSSNVIIPLSGYSGKEVPESVMIQIIRTAKSVGNDISSISNSADYYEKRVSDLQNKINDLNLEKNKIDIDSKNTTTQLDDNNPADFAALTNNQQKKLSEIDLTLTQISDELKLLNLQKEKKEQTEDAQTTWATKIKTAFTDLEKCLSPIIKEHNRLSILFYVYAGLSAIVVLIIIFFAYIVCDQLFQETPNKEFNFLKYLPFYIPIPISGGLLWAFIFQMNRAQRQLVVIADKIHHIKYVEGLLLALNSLSLNIRVSSLMFQFLVSKTM